MLASTTSHQVASSRHCAPAPLQQAHRQQSNALASSSAPCSRTPHGPPMGWHGHRAPGLNSRNSQLWVLQAHAERVRLQPSAAASPSNPPAPSTSFTSDVQQQQQQQGDQQVQELRWPWRWGSNIRYYRAGTKGPPLVLVHGFGVGAWHFERNLEALAKDYQVYAVDLLGQGSSWPNLPVEGQALLPAGRSPSSSPSPEHQHQQHAPEQESYPDQDHGPLRFSITTWTDQLTDFIQQVVGGPAYIAGNSLGGYVSVSLAATHPDLALGLVLLNSTPFWSFRPHGDQPQGLWGLLGFDGTVPVPQNLKRTVEKLWWNNLRNRQTVESMLSMVYYDKATVQADHSLADRIIEATEHPSALDTFVSIVGSPKSAQDFDSLLCAVRCPVSLAYGRQDPWVVPMWGQRAAYVLAQNGSPPPLYLELDGAGHCPHHEAPVTTNLAMQTCLSYMEEMRRARQTWQPGQPERAPPLPIAVGQRLPVQEADGRIVTLEHVTGQPRFLPEHVSLAAWKLLDGQRMAQRPLSPARSKSRSLSREREEEEGQEQEGGHAVTR